MKLIIAGGRKYLFTEEDTAKLDRIRHLVTEVVSGKATGADTCGEDWANKNGIPIESKPADWARYGKPAGCIRNREMAKYADAVALFPGNEGTANMWEEAKAAKLHVYDMTDDHRYTSQGVPEKIDVMRKLNDLERNKIC